MNRTQGCLFLSSFVLAGGLLFGQDKMTPVITNFQDVSSTGPNAVFFPFIQIAKNVGIAVPSFLGACVTSLPTGANPPILPPGGVASQSSCPYFGPDAFITRAEAAYWVIKAQFDETQIGNFLCATGGDPSGLSAGCNSGITASSFADVGVGGASIVNPFVQPNPALGITGVTNRQLERYIEVMSRRGYTKGCSFDPLFRFCPNDLVNRAQVAVFIIRAKMNNVFPTTLSGIPVNSPYGDNFGFNPTPYFTDVTPNDPVWGQFFSYIQKLRELNITNGTSPTTFSPANHVTRKEMATFIVRGFFL